jgi:DNA-binding NtrC family response regulator
MRVRESSVDVREAGVLLVSREGKRRWGALGSHARCVFAATAAEASALLLPGIGLVVTDARLADGTGDALFASARMLEPPPLFVILQGEGLPEPVVRLIEAHARAHFGAHAVAASGEEALIAAASLEVGRLGVREAQDVVRRTMYLEALARTKGSRKAAARLLGVDRRAVQRIAADLDRI